MAASSDASRRPPPDSPPEGVRSRASPVHASEQISFFALTRPALDRQPNDFPVGNFRRATTLAAPPSRASTTAADTNSPSTMGPVAPAKGNSASSVSAEISCCGPRGTPDRASPASGETSFSSLPAPEDANSPPPNRAPCASGTTSSFAPGVLTNASDLGAKRLATSQLLVSGRRHEPDPDFGSGAGDWELHDEENADPATAARATARASRRGNALAPLPGTSSRKNAKRKFAGSDAGDDDGSSASSASDATLVEQPRRKKARYDLMELGFPPLSAKCKPSDGIEYCVGQQPLYEEGVSFAVPPLCRLAGCRETRCKKLGRGPAKDFFCASHYSEVTGKESRADLQGGGFPALALSKVPPGVDACVGKPPEKKKSGKYFQNYCRLAGCEKTRCKNQGKGPDCDHFCKSHFRDFALDQSQWKSAEKAWDGKEFPKLIHTSVPAGVDANVGKAPRRENGVLLCRLATCKRSKCRVPSQGKRCEYFCGGCHTRYLTANQEYAEEMEQLHARKVRDGDTINTTLRQHLLDQSFDAATDGDADVHLRENKLLFHFTAASSLDHWERNNAGEIQLKPNNQLKRATLNEHTPHWLKMSRKKREDGDDKVWTTPSFLGGWKFLADHHKCPPERGTVWHVLVIASDNSAYKTFGQHRWNGKDISQNHELMCDSAGRDVVPNLVLRVEFRDSNIKNAKMTVVRVNGDAANEVEIDAEDPRFKITEETISWSE